VLSEAAALHNNLLFQGVPPQAVDEIARPLRRVELAAGETVFHEGDRGDVLYLVLSGVIEIYTQRGPDDVTIRTFTPGTYFGELALLGQETRSASARAIERSVLVEVDGPTLERAAEQHLQVAANIGRVLASQLVATTKTSVHVQRGELVLLVISESQQRRDVLAYLLEATAALSGGRTAALVPRSLFPGAPYVATAIRDEMRPAAGEDKLVPDYFGFRGGALLEATARSDAVRIMADYFRRWWRRTVIVVGDNEREWLELVLPFVDRVFMVGLPQEIASWRPAEGSGLQPSIEVVPALADLHDRRAAAGIVHRAGFALPRIWLPDLSAFDGHVALGARGFNRGDLTNLSLPQQRSLLRLARALARQRIGLALGAGGARGMAHIGVFRYLEEQGVPVDAVAGTSMGAMVGGGFATGLSSHEAEQIVRRWMQTSYRKLMRPALSFQSILSGREIYRVCRDIFGDRRFVDTVTPLTVIAADLVSGRGIAFKNGRIAPAIQASMSIPGMFPPVLIGPYVLVDGGVCDPVPSGPLLDLGADIRIVVNISYKPDDLDRWAREEGAAAPQRPIREGKAPNIVDTYMAAIGIALSERAASMEAQADVNIRPRFLVTSWREFSQASDHLRRGYEAAERARDQLHDAVSWLQ
jgi:NTE family protein